MVSRRGSNCASGSSCTCAPITLETAVRIPEEVAVRMLVWLLEKGYAHGCKVLDGIVSGAGYPSDWAEVEELTIVTFG